ncbi:YihY/virulence factor BrkB family protein [Chitiniphilus purpureus]|uniref:YihY/virulence factor BrkB family protein n=1 Tax=Chitiniphilus purpureus TaxID=2981137 RepID=A0ABY6DL85_9NEIS|nr:YihY/virulence factor BrkB family protein [Chitiniphilus sp. CD1]UXY15125.1 YihY/virulence factor BrkB family protein [Chitiniphilus sp. CD1]
MRLRVRMARAGRRVMVAGRLLKAAAGCWSAHRASTMGAAIAFYTLFSMGPVLIIAIAIAGYFYGRDAAQLELLSEIQALMGPNAAVAVSAVIDSAQISGQPTWHTLLALGTSIFAATTVFSELKGSLDVIWGTRSQRQGVLTLLRARLLSFGIVVSAGFVLLASLLVSTALNLMQDRYAAWFGEGLLLMELANLLVTLAVVTLLFASIYKLLPDEPIPWRDVWFSALITAGLYMVGKSLIALYLGTTAVGSSYGAAGALVLVLVWIYYAAQIFLFGAELARQVTILRSGMRAQARRLVQLNRQRAAGASTAPARA